jgi:hypothetical protein
MKTKLVILGCLAIVGAGVLYFFLKNKTTKGWEEENYEPVGPIQGNIESENFEHTNTHLREVKNAAKAPVL